MPRILGSLLSLTATALILFDASAIGQDKLATEKDKIEALIKHLEGLKDVKFIRNNSEYDAKTAARFVRGKWDSESTSIKTAKDFIEKAASVSGTSGKPYLIRFKSGKELTSREFLTGELKKLEKGESNPSNP
jgi:hypothetical protein